MNAWTWIYGEVTVASVIFHLLLHVWRRRHNKSKAGAGTPVMFCLVKKPLLPDTVAVCE